MGNCKSRVVPLTVDPPGTTKKRTKTFAPTMFKRLEWEVLKVFCQKYEIRQTDLLRVFDEFLSHEEVYLRDFRVRTIDPKLRFVCQTKLQQELADVLVPPIYLRIFAGLDNVENNDEVSFARFIITGYIFCCQQPSDMIYDFIAILRQKLVLGLHVMIPAYSVSQICNLLLEDAQQRCGAVIGLKRGLHILSKGSDLKLEEIIRLGIKYPMLFYALHKFRKIYRRFFFGEVFWKNRKPLKIKHLKLPEYKGQDINKFFETEEMAICRTSKAIIADCMYTKSKSWELTSEVYPIPAVIDEHTGKKLKSLLGYKMARLVIIESGIATNYESTFTKPFQVGLEGSEAIAQAMNLTYDTDSDNEEEKEREKNDRDEQATMNVSTSIDDNSSVTLGSFLGKSMKNLFEKTSNASSLSGLHNNLNAVDDEKETETEKATPHPQLGVSSMLGKSMKVLFSQMSADQDELRNEIHDGNAREEKVEIVDATLPNDKQKQAKEPLADVAYMEVHDPGTGRIFQYNTITGRSQWLSIILDMSGDVLHSEFVDASRYKLNKPLE